MGNHGHRRATEAEMADLSNSELDVHHFTARPPSTTSSRQPDSQHVAMIDSWSNGEDRRDRGRVRVDRGLARSRASRSPPPRRHDGDRELKERTRSPAKPRDHHHEKSREGEPSYRRRRRASRSPRRDSGEAVRERNRGRELLDTRGTDKPKRSTTHHSPSSSKRRKSRSPSPSRSHHKRSRRETSRSLTRTERGLEKKHRTLSPPPPQRKRSIDRRPLDNHIEAKYKPRESGAFDKPGRSPNSRHDRHEPPLRRSASRQEPNSRRERSPVRAQKLRERSPFEKIKGKDRKRNSSPRADRRSPDIDRYEPSNRSRPRSPAPSRGSKASRGRSPRRGDDRRREDRPREDRSKDNLKDNRPNPARSRDSKPPRGERPTRNDYRPSKPNNAGSSSASGANNIEVRSRKPSPVDSGGNPNFIEVRSRKPSLVDSGVNPNSIEVKSDKMNGRGFYGGQQGYNPHQQMQAAFPLKPQFNQSPQVDSRQYSQSPQHHMATASYHGSPQAPQSQSPYGAGRAGWGGQQYSPPTQSQQNFQQQSLQNQGTFPSPGGPQSHYHNSQSPPYHMPPTGPMSQQFQQNFRGNQRGGFRGNHFNNNMRGGRGDFRGGRGNHFQNSHWNSGPGAGRGQPNNSGPATPQHASPQQHIPPQNALAPAPATPQQKPQPKEEDDGEDLFRPSKALQVEEKGTKKDAEEKMPPPSKTTPTGPQSQQPSKFSFAFKGPAKANSTLPKPEISQKLSVASVRKDVLVSPERSRAQLPSRGVPTEPASARRPEFREPAVPIKRMVKKTFKRPKARPQLKEEFKKSDSVYYRKPGNESVVGSGTYGKVFKAIHVYTKDLVALKKIRMEGERDGFPVTAVREIKLLQSLKHDNIVNLQEVMVEKNDCFMVFEYLSHDLTGLLNHPTFKLEPAHKKHLAKQLFEGLDYLHRRGVLHRDIKAANILVSNEGQLKIADFGLARFYAKRRQLDYTNRVITIWYRSPELLLGETQYGPAVDIWSAACVLVEIFTRHAIFPGDGGEISQLEKIYAVLGTPNKADWPGLVDMAWFELLRPSAKRPNVFAEKYKERVTPAAYELLEAMFQYDPVKRPSASDVLEHPYFTVEDPKPRQVIELSKLEGDWHEFESKALRKENERKDKEARKQAQKDAVVKGEKEKKRGSEGDAAERDAKRLQTAPPAQVTK